MKTNTQKRIPIEDIIEKLESMGLHLYKLDNNMPITSQKFSVYDDYGYYYTVWWSAIYKGIFPHKFYNTNPYVIQNINHFLTLHHNGEYVCVSRKYISNSSPLEFIHLPCMKKFTSTLVAFQGKICSNGEKYYKQCPFCSGHKLESYHASVLKQIFLHEYKDTIVEDRSCINPNTGRVLPTDIVNHRLKIAIEIQSNLHDKPEKQELDKIKSDYWIGRRYSFYTPDIRDYSVIEMIQLFFPNIHTVPNYIDINYSVANNPQDVQKLFNQGLTVREISKCLNISVPSIHGMMASGSALISIESKRRAINAKSLVHLSKEGDFIKEYEYLNDVTKDGFALGTIQRVLNGTQKYAYDSYWVYGENYYNNTYTLPTIIPDINELPIYSIKNGNKTFYQSIYEASNDLSVHCCEIRRILKGDRKTLNGYQFIYA